MPAADPNYEGQARVYRNQGATAQVIASGGTLEIQPGGNLNAASGTISLPANWMKGVHSLDLMNARVLSSGENFIGTNIAATGADVGTSVGGMITGGANSNPSVHTLSTASKVHVVTWASAQAQVIRPPIFVKPPDFDSSQALTINILSRAQQVGTNLGWQIDVWDNVNATNIGSTTPALVTSAWTKSSITVSPSANLTAYPGTLAISLSPKTHANDAMDLQCAWIEYQKRSS